MNHYEYDIRVATALSIGCHWTALLKETVLNVESIWERLENSNPASYFDFIQCIKEHAKNIVIVA